MEHCVNCKETKDFADTGPRALESAAGIPTPILLITASIRRLHLMIAILSLKCQVEISRRDFTSQASTKKSFTTFIFHICTLKNK